VLARELAGKSPADASVAKIVNDAAKNVPSIQMLKAE
jgi:hypothetical protein